MSQGRSQRRKTASSGGMFTSLADFFARLFAPKPSNREGMARDAETVVGTSQPDEPTADFGAKGLITASPTDALEDEFEYEAPQPQRSGRRSPRPKPGRSASEKSHGAFFPIFWTITGTVSILLNVILIAGLLLLGRQLFVLKALVSDDLLSGLYENFVLMDDATIKTEVHISKDIPVTFDLPLDQDTVVALTENTSIYGAYVSLNSGGVVINAPADIVLPEGQQLPIHLQISVPVSVTVPVELDVPVSIPLSSTELHEPFMGLRSVIGEFYNGTLPNIQQPQDLAFCQKFPSLCELYFK